MKINEIFYSLQGEGFWTGTPMIFLRLSGCNLRCLFCDTDWTASTEMSADEILSALSSYPSKRVCITGGEPCLQLTADFLSVLHAHGYTVHVESNGTIPPPAGIDWLTLSPKSPFLRPGEGELAVQQCDELKLLYPSDPSLFDNVVASHRFLQPIDAGNPQETLENTRSAVQYVREHPAWRLSLQIHKFLNIR